jgi:TrwC relaxase
LQIERGTGKDGRYFEVKGVPRGLAERWSTRTTQIEKAAREFKAQYGCDPKAGELGSLTTSTRGTKTALAPTSVDAAWKAVAGEHGLTRDHAHALLNDSAQAATQDRGAGQRPDLADRLVERVTAKSSMVSGRKLYATPYELSAGVCHPSQAQELVKDLARAGELIKLQGGEWTTKELREREQQTIATVKERAGQNAAAVREQSLRETEREVAREIGGPLSQEQREGATEHHRPRRDNDADWPGGTGKGVCCKPRRARGRKMATR